MRKHEQSTYFLVLLIVEPERGLDALPPVQEGAPDDDLVHEPEVEPQAVDADEIYRVGDDLRSKRKRTTKVVIAGRVTPPIPRRVLTLLMKSHPNVLL